MKASHPLVSASSIVTVHGEDIPNIPVRFQSLPSIAKAIDAIGEKSAIAQGLRAPVTSWIKLSGTNHHLYILQSNEEDEILGIIKVAHKKLFIVDPKGQQKGVELLCVLDFYIREDHQRKGLGVYLFNRMLQTEQKSLHQLALDRPSPKFISFLKKHFGITNFLIQPNRFVVFPECGGIQAVNKDSCRVSLELAAARRKSLAKTQSSEELAFASTLNRNNTYNQSPYETTHSLHGNSQWNNHRNAYQAHHRSWW